MGLFLLSWYLYDTCFDSTTDIIVWEIIKRICYDNNISLGYTHNIICMYVYAYRHFWRNKWCPIRFKADLFLYDLEFDEIKMTVFDADNDDFTLTLYNLNYGHDYVINVNDTQGDTRNGTQDRSQKQIFDTAVWFWTNSPMKW